MHCIVYWFFSWRRKARAWAQGEASINGTVTDATGAIIAGATVKVKNVETGRDSHAGHRRRGTL